MKNCSKQPTYYEEKVLANYLTSFIFEGKKQLVVESCPMQNCYFSHILLILYYYANYN